MANGRTRRCSASLIAGETQNHSETAPRAWEHGFRHTSRDDKPGGGRGARTPCCWGRSRARPLRTTPRRLLHALSTRPPRGPEIPWLGIHPERRKARTRRGACVRTCTAAWLAAEETWKPTIGRRTAMHGRRSRVCDGGDRPRGHRTKCERERQIPCDPPRLRASLRKRTHDPTARNSLSR